MVKLAELIQYADSKSAERIEKAYLFSQKYLSSVQRRTGENYFEHGCEVARTVHEVSQEPLYTVVAILHDLQSHQDGEHLLGS